LNTDTTTFNYIPRRLVAAKVERIPEDWATATGVFVLIGEPGFGKSRFLEEVARVRGCPTIRSTRVLNRQLPDEDIIVDGLDEVAMRNPEILESLLDEIGAKHPRFVLLATRSSCWGSDLTEYCNESFDQESVILTLQPFDFEEQKKFYLAHQPDGNFEDFRRNTYKSGLGPLLGNPQLMKLLLQASTEGTFQSKSEAFALASQRASLVQARGRPVIPSDAKLAAANEIFAKLLLSNSGGVATTETRTDDALPLDFPLISAICPLDFNAREILESNLFRPSGEPDCHEPIHRTVAEYGAARYLTVRLNDPQDLLSLRRLNAIIAPNGVLRSDLKGLAGWLGSLGTFETQLAFSRLAPYEVLTDGDPSRLTNAAANELLKSLIALAGQNPYFRNQDVWRTFSSQMTQLDPNLVRGTLANVATRQQLRELLLEVLIESPQEGLRDTLETIILNPSEDFAFRKAALYALLKLESCDIERLYHQLYQLGDQEGFELAARVATKEKFRISKDHAYQLLKPTPAWHWSSLHDAHDYVLQCLTRLPPDDLTWIVEELIRNQACHCGKPAPCWRCQETHSKELGRVLDIYVESAIPPDPEVIARTVQHMRFHRDIPSHMSASVKRLREDKSLRRAVQEKILSRQIAEQARLFYLFWSVNPHSGVRPQNGDREYIANWCATNKAWDAWRQLIPVGRSEEESQVRRFMENQAKEIPELMAQWNAREESEQEGHPEIPNYQEERATSQARRKSHNKVDFDQNRDAILAGEDDRWFEKFARNVLNGDRPADEEWKVFDDESLPLRALASALPRLNSHLPNLEELAQHAIENKVINAVYWIEASVVARLRLGMDLEDLPDTVWYALMTRMDSYPRGVSKEEHDALLQLVTARLFDTNSRAESFLRTYIEPQLQADTNYPEVFWLNQFHCFHPLRESLALEWITNFPNLRIETQKRLFSMIQNHCSLKDIQGIVDLKLEQHFSSGLVPAPSEADPSGIPVHTFWAVAHLFYSESLHEAALDHLGCSPDHLFRIREAGARHHRPDLTQWPKLAAERVDWVIRTFLPQWPPVFLPDGFATGSPEEEQAFRFLDSLVWSLAGCDAEATLPIVESMLKEEAFACFRNTLLHVRFEANQKLVTRNVTLPDWRQVVGFLDSYDIVSVEDLRASLIDTLTEYSAKVRGSGLNYWRNFYDNKGSTKTPKYSRVDENRASEVITQHLDAIFAPRGITVKLEDLMVARNRCDITFTRAFSGRSILLPVEAKGQWHKDLFSAAQVQLHERYSCHPDAGDQGIYLVFWFGPDELVAGRKNHDFTCAPQLQQRLSEDLPEGLKGKIDVFVLDVSRPG